MSSLQILDIAIGLSVVYAILVVSLGAPFWFGLLTRFINIRAAGIAPKKIWEGAKP